MKTDACARQWRKLASALALALVIRLQDLQETLLEIVPDLRFGREDSFKLIEGGHLLTGRPLLGLPKADVGERDILRICERLAMPSAYREQFSSLLVNANLVFFGLEQNASGYLCKAY